MARTRRKTTKRKTSPKRRRRTTKKKGFLNELFTRNEAQAGFQQALGVGAGFISGEYATQWINPNGDKNQLEIAAKLGGGFLLSTSGRMPSFGAGMMASGFKKILEVQGGLSEKPGNFLNEAPMIQPTNVSLNEGEMNYLSEYEAGYASQTY